MHDATEQFEMTVIHRATAEAVRVELSGDLDMHTAGIVAEGMDDLLHRGITAVDLDCGRLTFADSAGLKALLDAGREATSRDVGFGLVAMSDPLHRLVRITGTTELLPDR